MSSNRTKHSGLEAAVSDGESIAEESNMPLVSELSKHLQFVVDSQDVDAVKESIGKGHEYDSFFVSIQDGEYTQVYGMFGIVPMLSKMTWRVL